MQSLKRRKLARLLTLVATLALLGAVGCSNDRQVVDDTPPTTGEVEHEDDGVEFEAEKEFPEDETRQTGEIEKETEYGEVEIEMEDDEIEIEGELDYVKGLKMPPPTTQGDRTVPAPDPNKAVAVTEVFAAPVDLIGTTVFGTAKVTSVISDRGFWVKSGGDRIFAIVREDIPRPEMIDINAGQELKFMGVLTDGQDWELVAGDLEPETVAILKEQPYFINVYWEHIKIMDAEAS